MEKKTIGILGGMGPLATVDLFEKITLHTRAQTDQQHLHVIIDSNTGIPDRTAALLHGGADPLPEMIKSARRLVAAGADVLIIPCNTTHCYYDSLQSAVDIPVLHMIALTRDALCARGVRRAALLATDGTLNAGIYQRIFAGSGIDLILPGGDDQAAVMDLIYNGIKAGDMTFPIDRFRLCAQSLLNRGAETLILGCTELPLAFSLYRLDYPATDPTLELALGAIRFAGGEVSLDPSLFRR